MQKSSSRYLQELSEFRKTADDVISFLWDEIEVTYKNLPEDLRREKCIEYGVVYVYRKNEINSISVPFNIPMPTLF